MILKTDLSAREKILVRIQTPSDEEKLQYDLLMFKLKVSFIFEECYEQFKAKKYCKKNYSLVDRLHPGRSHMHDPFVVVPEN